MFYYIKRKLRNYWKELNKPVADDGEYAGVVVSGGLILAIRKNERTKEEV